MPKILIVEGNTPERCAEAEAAGMQTQGALYADTLRSLAPDAHCDLIQPADPRSALPDGVAIEQYDGVAWTGSSLNVYHDTPEIRRQVEFARACFETRGEIFGSCWGLQVATVAAGGVVSANVRGREIGIARKIELTDVGTHHPLYDGKARVFDAVTIHLDHVTTLPQGAVVLAGNDVSGIQALEIRRGEATFWGVQYHPEFDLAYIGGLLRRYSPMMLDEGFSKDLETLEKLASDYSELAAAPDRRDLRWRLGADDDVLDERCRLLEIDNWLTRIAPT